MQFHLCFQLQNLYGVLKRFGALAQHQAVETSLKVDKFLYFSSLIFHIQLPQLKVNLIPFTGSHGAPGSSNTNVSNPSVNLVVLPCTFFQQTCLSPASYIDICRVFAPCVVKDMTIEERFPTNKWCISFKVSLTIPASAIAFPLLFSPPPLSTLSGGGQLFVYSLSLSVFISIRFNAMLTTFSFMFNSVDQGL